VENTLYFGDNLSVLTGRDGQGQPYFPDACVDLVYLDPPFNSNRSYNVLFKDEHGAQAPSQITAFADTWTWAIEVGMSTSEQGISKGMGLARAVRRIQILTIAELLAGKTLDLPQGHDIATLKRAQRAASTQYAQPALIGGAVPEC
jgi:hypothetical protein